LKNSHRQKFRPAKRGGGAEENVRTQVGEQSSLRGMLFPKLTTIPDLGV